MVMGIKDIIAKAGGAVALARALGIKHSSVCDWRQVPAERLPEVARLTGIPPHELRPDLAEIFKAPAA